MRFKTHPLKTQQPKFGKSGQAIRFIQPTHKKLKNKKAASFT
jgi:hypothetical protein